MAPYPDPQTLIPELRIRIRIQEVNFYGSGRTTWKILWPLKKISYEMENIVTYVIKNELSMKFLLSFDKIKDPDPWDQLNTDPPDPCPEHCL